MSDETKKAKARQSQPDETDQTPAAADLPEGNSTAADMGLSEPGAVEGQPGEATRSGRTADSLRPTVQDNEARPQVGPPVAAGAVAGDVVSQYDERRYEVLHANVGGHPQGSRVSMNELGITPRRGSSITDDDAKAYLSRLIRLGAVREVSDEENEAKEA
jgi:hypothetical protein